MMNDEANADELLTQLRQGNIWAITKSNAKNWLGQAKTRNEGQILSMRIRSLVAELADRRGWWEDIEPLALADLDPIKQKFFARNNRLNPQSDRDDFKWFRQAGWLLLQDVRREHRVEGEKSSREKHKGAAVRALDSAQSLQNQLEKILPDEGSHELLYRVAFSIARHLQVLKDYESAEQNLIQALRHCHDHRDEINSRLRTLEKEFCKLEEDFRNKDIAKKSYLSEKQKLLVKKQKLTLLDGFTVSNTTVVVANLGRIDVDRGNLTEAIPQLLIARTLLLNSEDIVMRGFVDLQLGSVYRQVGDENEPEQDIANSPMRLLESSLKLFQDAAHRPLEARARLELAQYYFGTAAEHPDRLKKASELLDPNSLTGGRWKAHSSLLRARIKFAEETQASAADAIGDATRALELAQQEGLKEVEVLARLVLAEAAIKNKEYDEAVKHCQKVEDLDPKDIADKAWTYVVLIDAWVKAGSLWDAEVYLKKWKSVAKYVENRRIKRRAGEVVRSYEKQRRSSFYISPEEEDIDVPRRLEELKEYLIRRAQASAGTLEEQAARLGVQAQTLSNWRSQIKRVIERGGSARFRKVSKRID
jgi:tetratricopeptide (TPR) repeat protein